MMAARRRERQQQEAKRAIVLSCTVLQLQMAPQQWLLEAFGVVLLGWAGERGQRGSSLLSLYHWHTLIWDLTK